MEDCIFCKIVKKEIPSHVVYEDENSMAFLDANPVNVGHTLLIPKKHFETMDKMGKEDFDKLTGVILKISGAMMGAASGMNLVSNNGKVAEQIIPHVHFHLIPRSEGDEISFEQKKKEITEEQSEEFLEKIKSFLK